MARVVIPSGLVAIFLVAPAVRADSGPVPTGAQSANLSRITNYEDTLRDARAKSHAKAWPEAADLWAKVVEANPCPGSFWESLAKARYHAKNYPGAVAAYEKVIERGYNYPWQAAYDIACCYALAGDKPQALRWLDKALAMGFRDLEHAQKDKDLESLRSDPKFRELLALADVAKMSRDEGWRYDLALLAREIKRKHYDPFKKVTREQFDAAVRKLDGDIPHLTDEQIIVGFMKLMAGCGDGHTHLSSGGGRGRKNAPVRFLLFEEGLFVVAADKRFADLAGARVLKIGDHTPAAVLEALDPVISQDNTMWPRFVGPDMMSRAWLLNGLGLISRPDRLPLTVRDRDGTERSVELPADAGDPTGSWVWVRKLSGTPPPLYLKNQDRPYWFEYLPDSKTVYFQFNAVQNDPKEPLDKFSKRLFEFIDSHDVDKLVIDMRLNGGGNNFLNRPLVHDLIRCRKVNQRGKLFVIIGRRTFSAAMNGATDIELNTEATFVGEPTGSRPNFVGESVPLLLPYSKIRGTISDLYWERSVAMDYRTWIPPTIYTPPTFADYAAHRDPAMEAILAYREPPKVAVTPGEDDIVEKYP